MQLDEPNNQEKIYRRKTKILLDSQVYSIQMIYDDSAA